MQSQGFVKAGCLGLLIAVSCQGWAPAKSPLQWVSFRRNKVDEDAPLKLQEGSGPWLVFAASFAGDGAAREATALAEELRDRYRLPAYIHSQTFDFSDSVEGIGVNPDLSPKRMRYDKSGSFQEYAVLVGDFNSIDDPDLQKTMKRLKYAEPRCLTTNKESTTRRFAGLREFNRRINGDSDKKRKGPMGNAFATPNPLLPREYFAPKGVDTFVIEMNDDVPFSLLDCPKPYTVRVATFRGNVVIDQERVAEIESGGRMQSRLEKAALKAHDLTTALRRQGVEAYEFHDRHESYVTVGSFDWVGKDRTDGMKEMNPEILAVINRYSPSRQGLVGRDGQALTGLQPKVVADIALDVQPWPVEVPRRSIATDYTRR